MSDFDLPPAAYIRLDLSPARVSGAMFDNGVLEKRRVIITDSHAYIFVDAAGGPIISNQWVLEDFSGRATTGYTVTVEGGDSFEVRRSTGCLCGSRLRSIRPFPEAPYVGSA